MLAGKGLDDQRMDKVAVEELTEGVYSATARRSTQARVTWWVTRAEKRGLTPFPLTKETLTLAGALLKRGAYRSASQCLYSIKKHDLRRGGALGAELLLIKAWLRIRFLFGAC